MAYLIGFLAILVYEFIGVAVAKGWYLKRHGVPIKIIGGGTTALFSSATPIMLAWPLALMLPRYRDPELCRHHHHILARDEARAQYNKIRSAYQRDEQARSAGSY